MLAIVIELEIEIRCAFFRRVEGMDIGHRNQYAGFAIVVDRRFTQKAVDQRIVVVYAYHPAVTTQRYAVHILKPYDDFEQTRTHSNLPYAFNQDPGNRDPGGTDPDYPGALQCAEITE